MENVRILKNVINNFLCLKEESAVKKIALFYFSSLDIVNKLKCDEKHHTFSNPFQIKFSLSQNTAFYATIPPIFL